MMNILIFILLIFAGNSAFAHEPPEVSIALNETESMALEYSHELKSMKAKFKSLSRFAEADLSYLKPRVSLEGNFRRVSEVPELNVSASGGGLKFGDNENYSIGPSLNWLLLDFGSSRFAYMEKKHMALAKKEEIAGLENKILLSARRAYFNVMLAMGRAYLIGESLNLSRARYDDIRLRYKAGSAARTDLLGAMQEVLLKKRDFRQSRSAVALAVRELSRITGFGRNLDLRFPADEKLRGVLSEEDEKPTVVLRMDSFAKIKRSLEERALNVPTDRHPSVSVFSELRKSYESARKSLAAARKPRLTLLVRSSLDYPNGPNSETVNQNILGIDFSMPILDGGRLSGKGEAKTAEARYAGEKGKETLNDIKTEWRKAKDLLEGFVSQAEINREALGNAEELASLTYDSYKAGSATFLEVKDAGLKVLKWKIEILENDIRILEQLAVMNNLSAESGKGEKI